MIYLETSRLRLRDWKKADLEPFYLMNADKKVMSYFPKTLSTDETNIFYQAIITEFKEYGFGLYAVELKDSKEFIGFTGFHRAVFQADFTPCIEIGWRLKKEAWGKGYATEGAKACLHYGFSQLNLTDVYSFTANINTPSQNVMKKIGMSYVKSFNHPKLDISSPLCEHVLYHINKENISL